jgi:hypothetical protein
MRYSHKNTDRETEEMKQLGNATCKQKHANMTDSKETWAGHVARMRVKRNAYRLLLGKPEGERPLGRPRRRRVDNIRMDLGEVG